MPEARKSCTFKSSFEIERLLKRMPDLRVVNCVRCGELLCSRDESPLGKKISRSSGLEPVAGRIKGRPYCDFCLRPNRPIQPGGGFYPLDDTGSWQDIAIRAMEDK